MKVYIVISYGLGGSAIVGVYKSEQKAYEIKEKASNNKCQVVIEEYIVKE